MDIDNRPRNLSFVRSAPERHWLGGDPVATAWFNALSLTFPDGERFFIDAVKAHRHLAEGKLAEDVKDFIVQEALHTREHAALNGHIDHGHYPVDKIEAMVKARTDLGRTRGPIPMLVVTTCLEHFTAILADDMLKNDKDLSAAPDNLRRLWLWHAVEETEHKSVAYDLWQRVAARWSHFGRYMIRVRAMAIVSCMFMWNVTTYALMLLKADGITGFEARKRLYGYLLGRPGPLRRIAGAYFDWYRPGFHPWDHDNRTLLDQWRPVFDAEARAIQAAE
ncbi:MAG TPA: metal-dependent hydrolase [Alphaproteobacteria bacterium]|nr:metal-dependent hydrolase [Alphaproteobacteria bacterium]HAJ45021.1 metal-dependent hydrolase [Alphaproteobacteria bacterium]